MNNTSPLRLTPAGYLAIAFIVSLVSTVWAFGANQPILYSILLPTTITLLAFTLDLGARYARR